MSSVGEEFRPGKAADVFDAERRGQVLTHSLRVATARSVVGGRRTDAQGRA
jgi:hypothetical protein